jgi:hypothetical protein
MHKKPTLRLRCRCNCPKWWVKRESTNPLRKGENGEINVGRLSLACHQMVYFLTGMSANSSGFLTRPWYTISQHHLMLPFPSRYQPHKTLVNFREHLFYTGAVVSRNLWVPGNPGLKRHFSSVSQSVLGWLFWADFWFWLQNFYECMSLAASHSTFDISLAREISGWHPPSFKSPSQTKLVYSLFHVPQPDKSWTEWRFKDHSSTPVSQKTTAQIISASQMLVVGKYLARY